MAKLHIEIDASDYKSADYRLHQIITELKKNPSLNLYFVDLERIGKDDN